METYRRPAPARARTQIIEIATGERHTVASVVRAAALNPVTFERRVVVYFTTTGLCFAAEKVRPVVPVGANGCVDCTLTFATPAEVIDHARSDHSAPIGAAS